MFVYRRRLLCKLWAFSDWTFSGLNPWRDDTASDFLILSPENNSSKDRVPKKKRLDINPILMCFFSVVFAEHLFREKGYKLRNTPSLFLGEVTVAQVGAPHFVVPVAVHCLHGAMVWKRHGNVEVWRTPTHWRVKNHGFPLRFRFLSIDGLYLFFSTLHPSLDFNFGMLNDQTSLSTEKGA